jgi:TP901 family phage tail tape measure protein
MKAEPQVLKIANIVLKNNIKSGIPYLNNNQKIAIAPPIPHHKKKPANIWNHLSPLVYIRKGGNASMSPAFKLAVTLSWIDKMTGPVKKTFNSLKNAQSMIDRGQGWAESGKNISIAGAMASESGRQMVNSLRSLTGPTQEINDAMASLGTVTTSTMGSIEKSMAASRKAAVNWSKKHANSAAKFVRTTYMMASAGLNDVQALEATKTAMTVATATMGDAGEAANLVAVLYNNMGDKTKNVRSEMTRLGDTLTRTQQYFQFKNLGQLTEGLTYAVPSALQFGQSIEEVNTVLGMLNNAGLQGSQAGTAYAASMRTMIKASGDLHFALGRNQKGGISFIKTIENIRKRYGDFNKMSDRTKMAFQKAFGDEGLRAISLLMSKTDGLNTALKAVTNSAGAAAKAQKKMESASPSKQFQIFRQKIDAVKDSFAVNLLPSIIKTLPVISKLIEKVGTFAEKHPGIVKIGLGIFALGAAALTVFGPVLSLVGAVKMLGGNGLQLIGSIGKGLKYLQKIATSGKIVGAFKLIGSVSRTVGSVIVRALMGAASSVWSFTAALLANPITWIVLGVAALAAGIYLLIRNWNTVKTACIGFWKTITGIWGKLPGWAKGIFTALFIILAPIIAIPLLIIKNWNKIGPVIGNIIKIIGGFFANLGKNALQWGANLLEMFIQGIKDKIASLKKGLIYAAGQIKKFLGFHSPAEAGPGATAHKWAPNLMGMYANGIIAGTPGLRRAALGAALAISTAMAQAPGNVSHAPAYRTGAPVAPARAASVAKTETSPKKPIIFDHCTFNFGKVDDPRSFVDILQNLTEEIG